MTGPDLRIAARRAIALDAADAVDVGARSHVGRLVVEVVDGADVHLVALSATSGDMRASCTCGRDACEHSKVALRWVAAGASSGTASGAAATEPQSSPGTAMAVARIDEPPSTIGERRSLTGGGLRTLSSDRPLDANRAAIAASLDDVLTEVVRAGASSDLPPPIESALERLLAATPRPTPVGVARWIGRLRVALAARDVAAMGRVLEAARTVADALRDDSTSEARARVSMWLGVVSANPAGVERVQDRTLLEVARERVHGLARDSLERRYLVDVQSGDVLREEGERERGAMSSGPCPRRVEVGLADVELGVAPRRVRLLQYAIVPNELATDAHRVTSLAVRLFRAAVDEYRLTIERFAALAEPFVVLAPARVERDALGPVLIDDAGDPLPLARRESPASPTLLGAWLEHAKLQWIAGRLVDAQGTVMLIPSSAALEHEGETVVRRF